MMDKILIVAIGATVIAASVLLLRSYQSTMDGVEWREVLHTVQDGDTLWTISSGYCPDHVDRREWIEEVQTLNGLRNSNIHVGQTLIVLVPVKERECKRK